MSETDQRDGVVNGPASTANHAPGSGHLRDLSGYGASEEHLYSAMNHRMDLVR